MCLVVMSAIKKNKERRADIECLLKEGMGAILCIVIKKKESLMKWYLNTQMPEQNEEESNTQMENGSLELKLIYKQ